MHISTQRVQVWWLALGAFHLHLTYDLLGSGIGWPIQYLWLFSGTFYHTPYGWELDAWQNWIAVVTLLLVCGHLAIRSGHSVAETMLPAEADKAVVAALQQRFASPSPTPVMRPGADIPWPAVALVPHYRSCRMIFMSVTGYASA